MNLLTNSTFENNGDANILRGGAIYISNSNLTISNTNFTRNKAERGGAIYFSWTNNFKGNLNIKNCIFSLNSAVFSGGSVQYNLYRPYFNNNQFVNNFADYGPNIASYPIKIEMNNTSIKQIVLNNIGSGVEEKLNLKLYLYDHDNQVTTLENSAQIMLKPIQNNTDIKGQSKIVVNKGMVHFNVLSFEAEPGMSNVPFKLTSDAINLNLMKRQYGADYNLKNLMINFRF